MKRYRNSYDESLENREIILLINTDEILTEDLLMYHSSFEISRYELFKTFRKSVVKDLTLDPF